MTTIKETQIEALKAKMYSVLHYYNDDSITDEIINVLVSEWIDENNIIIID